MKRAESKAPGLTFQKHLFLERSERALPVVQAELLNSSHFLGFLERFPRLPSITSPNWLKKDYGRGAIHINPVYWSDLGSDLFFGVFLFSRAISSLAEGGDFTLPPRIISLALSFCL